MFMGIIAMTTLHYRGPFAKPEVACFMRQFDDPWLKAGPRFQPLRGLIFALAFYPIPSALFGRKFGWAVMWWLLVALGILGTFGPAGGSLEGMIYTTTPPLKQTLGYVEMVPQALLLSLLLCYWVNHPKKWLNWILGILFFLSMALPVLGFFAQR